ncbi:hypothetical protein D6T64_00365 [Cryobacterium melibiosiphilum]|uniref:Uncharacterized protein n=1 Tax=Cryobacterium melibiosiphilum TaxID=995039 RepID=A0A3A5MSN2_9MICO|nr:hypothetical protein [Cryobacterium melibiosiphilum]RJT92312.1 hypothetical protein D6T64_00365 [Cryobacterium melibiosiphilum]
MDLPRRSVRAALATLPRRAARRRVSGLAAGLAVVVTLGLTGCGQAPWLAESGATSGATTSATTATPTAGTSGTSARTSTRADASTPVPTIAAVVNDLASGSAAHTVAAGDVSLAVNYWSTLRMDQWTAAASKPVNVSLVGSLGSDSGQDMFLSKLTVVAVVNGPTGALTAPPAFTDQATVSPGYDMKTPQSYSQVIVLPAVAAAATSITLSFTYELLVQTNTKVPTYAKQTATDQLTIALTQ